MKKFSLQSSPLGNVEAFRIVRNDCSFLEILSGFGAGLNAWQIFPEKNLDEPLELLDGYRDEEIFWETNADVSAGVRLCPWPGRTNNANWNWNGKNYALESNVSWASHALHGLSHTKPWRFIAFESDEASAELTLGFDWAGNHPGFPFPFHAETKFIFTGESFTVKTKTKNVGQNPMPYAEGFHPYFMLDEKVERLSLELSANEKVLVDSFDIPTGAREENFLFEKNSKLGKRFINDCFALKNPEAITSSFLRSSRFTLRIWQKTEPLGYRFIQVYTPNNGKSIAIEPMTHEPDVLNHHRDLTILEKGGELELEWGAEWLSN